MTTDLDRSLTNIRNFQASALAELDSLINQQPIPGSNFRLLPIPFVTQDNSDPDADDFDNDCGPACFAMFLNDTATPDEIYRSIRTDNKFTSFWQLQDVGYRIYGLATNRDNGLDIRQAIRQGLGVMLLVNYGTIIDAYPNDRTEFRRNHFIVVVGFDDENFIVHDPLRLEGGLRIRNEILEKAWSLAEGLRYGALVTANKFEAESGNRVRYKVVSIRGKNIRNEPSISGKDIGDLAPGSIRQVYEIMETEGNVWGRIGANRWMALVYNNRLLAESIQ